MKQTSILTLVNVGKNTTLGDGDVTQELVQLLIVTDGELQVTRNDTCLLVVTSSVTSQLQDFGSKILKNSSQVDRSTLTIKLVIDQNQIHPIDLPAPTR